MKGIQLQIGSRNILKGTLSFALIVLVALFSLNSQADTKVTYYHNDLLGSTTAATDEEGLIIWREAYRPFGEQQVISDASDEDRIAYTGKLHNDTTGLTYMNARYYDPVVGRFMAIDPVGPLDGGVQHLNRYSYVYNNPFRYTDPTGLIGMCGCGSAGAGGENNHTGLDPESDPGVQRGVRKGNFQLNELKEDLQFANAFLDLGYDTSLFEGERWKSQIDDIYSAAITTALAAAGVKKAINSNLEHAVSRAVERGIYPDEETARRELKKISDSITKSGKFPKGSFDDPNYKDRVLSPAGEKGLVSYQVTNARKARMKTVLVRK